MNGDQFRQSKSSSKPDAVPPRDKTAADRYAQHLPFQVFCCEAGTHVVDPEQSYYRGISYRAGTDFHNLSSTEPAPHREPDAPCLDSSQAWFCRDLWISKARDSTRDTDLIKGKLGSEGEAVAVSRTDGVVLRGPSNSLEARQEDTNAGSDYDAMPDPDVPPAQFATNFSVPNTVYNPARILVNPRCVTTYAGVSHTQLALDLFGPDKDETSPQSGTGKYVLGVWKGAPESFVCQEQRSVPLLSELL
jgi:hypothetical protein